MKTPLLSLLLSFYSLLALAQPDLEHDFFINYSRCFGSKVNFTCMMPHSGGSIFALGIKNKSTMDWDVLFYKLAANTFDTLWSKQYGGSSEDNLGYMCELPDKSILLAGTTKSKDGDVWYGHTYSAEEIWVLRVDTMGNIIKGNVFGGSGGSYLNALRAGPDGHIYLSGITLAKDYDFAHVGYGMFDADPWVARIDTQLQLQSVLVLPGNDFEGRPFVESIEPNSIIFGFSSMGTNSEVYGNLSKGLTDIVVMHLDSNLNIKWGKRIGGSNFDAADGICRKLNNGKFAIVGRTQSCDGDISFKRDCGSGPGATVSMLLAIMDTLGVVHHCKAYGDSNTLNYSLAPNGLQVTGALVDIDRIFLQFTTKGEGGDVNMNSWNRQRSVAWIGEFDTVANLKGCKTIDGGAGFFGRSIFKYNNNLYWDVLCGNNETNLYRCDTSVVYDFLMGLTLTPLGLETVNTRNSTIIVYPNPANNILYLQLNANIFLENSMFYQILGVDGQIYNSGELKPDQNNQAQIDIGQLDTGWYILKTKLNKSEIRTTFSKL